MGKKKVEDGFDFEKAYQEILDKAKDNGMADDMVFQTLMKEFKRMKQVCDELYTKIEEVGVCYQEETFKDRQVFKSNPLTKEYVSAHKTLVSTCGELNEMLAKVSTSKNDWL